MHKHELVANKGRYELHPHRLHSDPQRLLNFSLKRGVLILYKPSRCLLIPLVVRLLSHMLLYLMTFRWENRNHLNLNFITNFCHRPPTSWISFAPQSVALAIRKRMNSNVPRFTRFMWTFTLTQRYFLVCFLKHPITWRPSFSTTADNMFPA